MAETDVTRIAGNISALNALNSLGNINKQLAIHQARLASGKRINSAADDPAGLTIATKMDSHSEGLKAALSNIGDAKNLLAVAESGVGKINDILVQMRNKSMAGASDTMGSEERSAIVNQLDAYANEINDIVNQTTWNGVGLITGNSMASTTPTSFTFQTGDESTATTTFATIGDLTASTLGIDASVTSGLTDATSFETFLDTLTTAISTVNSELGKIGSMSSSLTFKEDQVTSAQVNVEAAYNRIMNADMAQEQVDASKYSILQQTATAMLSQANQAPQFLLSLFR